MKETSKLTLLVPITILVLLTLTLLYPRGLCAIYSWLIIVLLVLKITEQWKSIVWTLRYGDVFRKSYNPKNIDNEEDFKQLLATSQPQPFPFFPGNVWLTRWIGALYSRGGVVTRLIGCIFRSPPLMLIGSFLNIIVCYYLFSHRVLEQYPFIILLWTSRILAFLLFVSLVTLVSYLLIYRYIYGALDNILTGEYVGGSQIKAYQFPLPQYVAVRRFISIFIVMFVIVIISYGSIYFALYSGIAPDNSFYLAERELTRNGKTVPSTPGWIEMLYFSTTTLCTVGFGDIYPLGWLSKLVVMTQMLIGFTLLVMLLTAFVASLDPSEGLRRSD